jgi:hypothetical protein
MHRTTFAVILLLCTGFVVGCSQAAIIPTNTSVAKNESALTGNYSTAPLMECSGCVDGKGWGNRSCCTADFDQNCLSKNGVLRFADLHPGPYIELRSCFQKAPDAGKACASGTDCLSGVCDLENASKSDRCILISKNLTGEKNQYYGQEFFTATYSCRTDKPGICTEAIENRGNPGWALHYFEMNGTTLIETLTSGPIY